jgi:hypothetical protein
MTLTLVGLTFLNPLSSPVLSSGNGFIFFFSACTFHLLLDNLPYRRTRAKLVAKAFGFVLLGCAVIGFSPGAALIRFGRVGLLKDISDLFQNIAFCVIFLKFGLMAVCITKLPVRRSEKVILPSSGYGTS